MDATGMSPNDVPDPEHELGLEPEEEDDDF